MLLGGHFYIAANNLGCMVHASRKFYELYVTGKSQINEQAFLRSSD